MLLKRQENVAQKAGECSQYLRQENFLKRQENAAKKTGECSSKDRRMLPIFKTGECSSKDRRMYPIFWHH